MNVGSVLCSPALYLLNMTWTVVGTRLRGSLLRLSGEDKRPTVEGTDQATLMIESSSSIRSDSCDLGSQSMPCGMISILTEFFFVIYQKSVVEFDVR